MKSFLVTAMFGLASFLGVKYGVDMVRTYYQVKTVESRASDPESKSIVSNEEGKKYFMEGCDTGELDGGSFDQTAYCGCVYDEVVARYGVNYLLNSGLNDTQAEIESKFRTEIDYCVDIHTI